MRQLKITRQITRRDEDSLQKYLNDISKINVINQEKEIELAKRIKKGDEKALEELIKANLRFVVSVAKQYQNQGLSLPDLISEGNLGLIKAAEKYDETRGFKFISYAVWWIRQTILQALAEKARIVRLPLNQVGKLNKINRELSKQSQTTQAEPTIEDIADSLGLPSYVVSDLMQMERKHSSFDEQVFDDSGLSFGDKFLVDHSSSPDRDLENKSLLQDINLTFEQLPEREADIIRLNFGIGCKEHTLDEIGDYLGLTRERVRQIREKSLRRLRHPKWNRLLKQHLGK